MPHRSGFVAVVGRPNVGKSTLMNAYLGQKIAIISDKPQTTRHTQLGILTGLDAQVIFVDTPGMHEARNPLGTYMVEVATRAIQDADVVLFIVDVSARRRPRRRAPGRAHCQARRSRAGSAGAEQERPALARTCHPLHHAYGALAPPPSGCWSRPRAATTWTTCSTSSSPSCPKGRQLFPEDEVTQTHLRDLAAEFVREAALNLLEEEVPHGIAVEIDDFQERGDGNAYIAATLFVERKSHKGIVIGKGGAMLKQIGTNARNEIEALLGGKVFLDVHVKVRSQLAQERE